MLLVGELAHVRLVSIWKIVLLNLSEQLCTFDPLTANIVLQSTVDIANIAPLSPARLLQLMP